MILLNFVMMTQIVHQMKISSLHALKDLCHSYLKVTYHYLMISPVYGWKPPTTQQNGHHLKKEWYQRLPPHTQHHYFSGEHWSILQDRATSTHLAEIIDQWVQQNFLITDIHPKEVINETGKKW